MSDLSVDVLVNQCLPRFQKICETNGVLVKWEQESQFATQALQKNNKLRACEVETIQNSIINVAACGLTLNPADGYAYLVPEYNKGTGKNECMLRISFKGLIKAATDSGVIKWVRAEVVKENDKSATQNRKFGFALNNGSFYWLPELSKDFSNKPRFG